jgi:hypothetical protein
MPRRPILALLLALAATPAMAQRASDPLAAARLDRTLRAIEARRVTQPGLAARDAREAGNALARTPGGRSGQALRTGRRLDEVAIAPARGAGAALPPVVPRAADSLPSSTVPALTGLGFDPLDVVDQLIGRARAAAAEGRPSDAAADLQFAEHQLHRLPGAPTGAVTQRRAAIEALRAGLDASGLR